MDPKKFVGNVSGWVKDEETKVPITSAEVYVLDSSNNIESSIRRIDKEIALSTTSFKPKGFSDKNGRFLINGVPTPDGGAIHTVIVKAIGY